MPIIYSQLYKMQISEEVKEVKTNIDTARDFLSSQGTLSLLQVLLHDGFIGLMQLMDCEFWKMQNDSYSKGRFYSFNQRIGSDASFYNKTISQWLPFAKEYRGVYQIDIVKLIDSLISYSLSEDGIFEVIERYYNSFVKNDFLSHVDNEVYIFE